MFARALVVMLLVLNLGVAAWWALRAPPPAEARVALPANVPRLQLASSAARGASLQAAATPVPVALPADAACAAMGPFTDTAARAQARGALQPRVLRVREIERAAGRVRAWRVVVPPLPSADAAAAEAERIRAAGISDYFVMREGADANAIALGRYRSESAARERAAALVAAGFAARAEPVGGGALQPWLEIAAPAGVDLPALAVSLGLPAPAVQACEGAGAAAPVPPG